MIRLPSNKGPVGMDYRSYTDSLPHYADQLQLAAADILYSQFQIETLMKEEISRVASAEIAIETIGSDSRGEKAPQSQIDILVLHKSNEVIPAIVSHLRRLIRNVIQKDLFSGNYEIVNVEREAPLSYVRRSSDRAFPERILEACRIFGDEDLEYEAKLRVLQEITSDRVGKSIVDRAIRRKFLYRVSTRSGINKFHGQIIQHFDLQKGVSFYNPDTHQESFKQGPLRYVQNQLLAEAMQRARNGDERALQNITLISSPAFTPWKLQSIRWCACAPNELFAIEDHYRYFLWLYHLSQNAFEKNAAIKLEFDREEVKRRIEDMISITLNGIIKTLY